jgi:hypothetical protein
MAQEFAEFNPLHLHIVSLVPIEGVIDPYVMLESNETINQTITPTDIIVWNISRTAEFINQGQYRHHQDAPSIIDRFEGNIKASDCCGIESLMDPVRIGNAGLTVWKDWENNKSNVDYMYWGETERNCRSLFQINTTKHPEYNDTFRIDNIHAGYYFPDAGPDDLYPCSG